MSTIAEYVVLSQSENAAQQIRPSPQFTGLFQMHRNCFLNEHPSLVLRFATKRFYPPLLFQLLQVQLDSFRRRCCSKSASCDIQTSLVTIQALSLQNTSKYSQAAKLWFERA
jgi:hypothetical protein